MKRFARALFHGLPAGTRYEIFYQAARSLGIRAYLVDGKEGPFLGAVADRTIMRAYLRKKEWSPELLVPLSAALRDGGYFIDVGANIGLVSIEMAKLPNVKVLALEPDEENFCFLSANIAMQSISNITALRAAAWHEEAILRFARNNFNSGDHHISEAGQVEVRAQRLDDLQVPEGPLVIKIDTQGAEPSVLKGAAALLRRADLLVMEFWPWGMERMSQSPSDAISSLRVLGFGGSLIRGEEIGGYLECGQLCSELTEFAKTTEEYRSLDIMLRPS